jgi:hypothetical protein
MPLEASITIVVFLEYCDGATIVIDASRVINYKH